MDFEQTSENSLFADVRECREGVQFERTFRAICFLLHGWCNYDRKQKDGDTRPSSKLNAVPFDKLVVLACRVWDEMFRRSGKALRAKLESALIEEDQKRAVTFPCPLQEMSGKHGPGRAITDGESPPDYFISVIHQLQEEDILHYFQVTPYVDGKEDRPEDPRTTIEPSLPITDRKEFLNDFMDREMEVLFELENAIKRLDESQVQALGTHENRNKTIRWIEKEFQYLEPKRLAIIAELQNEDLFLADAQSLLEFANEACRKSAHNRKEYTIGRNLCLKEINDPDLKKCFSDCHSTPEEIWDCDEIKRLSKRAKLARALGEYLVVLGELHENQIERSHPADRTIERFEYVTVELEHCGVKGTPEQISGVFLGGKIQETVRSKLINLLELLATKSGN